jgi:hypothetical protein
MTTQKYYFARLNLMYSEEFYGAKKNFIKNTLNGINTITIRQNIWSFAGFRVIQKSDEDYIYAHLVKYKEDFIEEVLNISTREIENEIIENHIDASSTFFLHCNSNIVAYKIKGRIGNTQFRNMFSQVFKMNAHNGFFTEVELLPIDENHIFSERLKRLEEVQKISFRLHPCNPHWRDNWDDINDDINSMNASDYSGQYISHKPNGLNINHILNNKRLSDQIDMANDGYGEIKAIGKLNGKKTSINTGKDQVSVNI